MGLQFIWKIKANTNALKLQNIELLWFWCQVHEQKIERWAWDGETEEGFLEEVNFKSVLTEGGNYIKTDEREDSKDRKHLKHYYRSAELLKEGVGDQSE